MWRVRNNSPLNFANAFDVSGNFSSVLPFLRLSSGWSFSSALVSWLFATLAMLFALLFIITRSAEHIQSKSLMKAAVTVKRF